MRHFPAALIALTLAACASTPEPAAPPTAPIRRPATSALIGMSASELISRFGQPVLQVREGSGIKLQWSAGGCVLDTYLYPSASGRGPETVTHVDTRRPTGAAITQPECVALLLR